MKITFLGAGVFGTALAKIAEENGHEVRFYDPYKYPEISLSDATNGSDLNIFTAPSSAAKDILPKLDKETPLICASKGFLSLKPFSDFKNFSVFGGAGFADEITAKSDKSSTKANTTTFTTSSETAENVFSTETTHIEYTKDTLGVMLCGALKNLYALGAGLYGETGAEKASMPYLESAISEMQEILKVNGADPETLRLSCGAADLVLSCSEKGRNFRFGRELKETLKDTPKKEPKDNQTPESTTIESLSIIKSLADYPEFIIPESATLLKDIIKTVEDYHVAQ